MSESPERGFLFMGELMQNPRLDGALCDKCPFNTCVPVAGKSSQNSKLVILADMPAPGASESTAKIPGILGFYLQKVLGKFNLKISDVHTTYSVLCRPTEKVKPKVYKEAQACCAPRLENELCRLKSTPIVTMGNLALSSVTDKGSTDDWRGFPLESKLPYKTQVLPTYSPIRAHSNPALMPVMEIDIGRALKVAKGTFEPLQFPRELIRPDSAMLQALESLAKEDYVAVDIETTTLDPTVAQITCIGFANDKVAISIPWLDINRANPILAHTALDLLADPGVAKIFHNGVYDLFVFRRNKIKIEGPIHDTLLAHHVIAPQVPHDLGFVASCEFPAPRWKELTQMSFEDHQVYNARDAHMTYISFMKLVGKLKGTYLGLEQYEMLVKLLKIGLDMQERGVLVDAHAMENHGDTLRERCRVASTEFDHTLSRIFESKPEVKLGVGGTHPSLRKLFYKILGVKPTRFSKETGEPMLDEAALQNIIAYSELPAAREIAQAILKLRKPFKLLSTYVDGLPLNNSRIHPTWKVAGTITGRWASSGPNFQNIPKVMRNLFVPDKGNVIGGSDYSALELRLVALLAGDEPLISGFTKGLDIHKLNACGLFKKKLDAISDKERQIAKTFVYLAIYGGAAEKLRESLIQKGYTFTIGETKELLKNFKAAHPAIENFHRDLKLTAYNDWYVEEPWSGRRQYFHDGRVDENKVLNYPCQAGAGTLMNNAVLKVAAQLNKDEAIVAQVHDALYLQGPDPKRLKEILRESMTQTLSLNGYSLEFPVDFGYGPNMRDLK